MTEAAEVFALAAEKTARGKEVERIMAERPSGSGNGDIRRLIETGVEVNARYAYGSTLLYDAVEHGREEAVQLLLERGADPDLADDDGQTPLHRAVHESQVGIMTALLEAGADLNAKTHESWNAMMYAVVNGDGRMAAALMSYGADTVSTDRLGRDLIAETIDEQIEEETDYPSHHAFSPKAMRKLLAAQTREELGAAQAGLARRRDEKQARIVAAAGDVRLQEPIVLQQPLQPRQGLRRRAAP